MTASKRDKFLKTVETTAALLGHELEFWQRDSFGYFTTCRNCHIEVRVKVYAKVTTLTDEQCKGKREL